MQFKPNTYTIDQIQKFTKGALRLGESAVWKKRPTEDKRLQQVFKEDGTQMDLTFSKLVEMTSPVLMANEDRKAHLNVVKFLELAFSIACLALHFYSFNDGDIMTSFIATGTFAGFILIVLGIFAGILMRAPIHKRIDIFYSVIGSCLFITSGVLLIEAWEYSFRTRTRDLAIVKASLAIVNGALFGFDALFTLKDK